MCTRELSTGLRRRKAVRNRPAIKWSLFVPLSPAGGSTRSEKAKRVALHVVQPLNNGYLILLSVVLIKYLLIIAVSVILNGKKLVVLGLKKWGSQEVINK